MKTARCAACNQHVPTNGRGLFGEHPCPAKGTDASGPGYPVCPVHNELVWLVGPYSAYRGCPAGQACTAGQGGKPYRAASAPYATRTAIPVVPTPLPAPTAPVEPSTEPEDPFEGYVDPGSEDQPPHPAYAKLTKAPALPPRPESMLASLGSLGEMIQSYVDARAVQVARETAADLADTRAPLAINWTVNDRPFATCEGTHHRALPRLLKLRAAGFVNFLIAGPAGSGKTTLAHDLARSMGLDFASVSCTSGMSETALTGRAMPNLTTGETCFQTTEFIRVYENGGVFLLDEIDAADPNVMLVINSALANGHMPLPNRTDAPQAVRHRDTVVICAANTWGRGADRQYVGRNQLDSAFLDRFVGSTLEVEYDRDLESQLVGDAHICARVWEIRGKVADLRLRRVVGTRFLLAVARLVKGAGESIPEALLACTVDWTADERSKAGVAS